MKTKLTTIALLVFMMLNFTAMAQEEESESPFSGGVDIVSSYVWRGTKFGTGPAMQPYMEFSKGIFTIGTWGSYCFTTDEAAEADLYVSFSLPFGISLGLTDYYFPGSDYFRMGGDDSNHAYELNGGYEIGIFSLSANVMLNRAPEGVGVDNDLYFETGLGFEHFNVFLGAGNGWYSVEYPLGSPEDEDSFEVVNLGIGTSKDIKVSDTFTLPLTATAIWNPNLGEFHIVVGMSF